MCGMPQQFGLAATRAAVVLATTLVVVGGYGRMGDAVAVAPVAAQQTAADPSRFAGEIDAFRQWDEKNSFPEDGVLFVGSSSIRLWATAVDFPDLPVINRGFGGSQIPDVLAHLDAVALKYRPRVVVFYAGDNDIQAGRAPEQVLADYRTFVERVRAARADTRFVYIPIKPSIARWERWPEMQRANALVRELTDASPGLYYADTAGPMLGADGRPRPELFVDDGLHLSAAGYEVWTAVVRPVVDRALSTR